MRPSLPLLSLTAGLVLSGANLATASPICRPQLSFKQMHLSEPQELQRRWAAVLNVDARRCATTSGRFEVNIVREKENAPELEFREPFVWQTGPARTGDVEVSIDIWIDEAVHEYTVGYVTPCGCRN